MLQPWAGLCKAEGERPGLPCNFGWGTGGSVCREGKEGEKEVTALVGMCLQGLLCHLCPSHLTSPPWQSVGQCRQRSLKPDWGNLVALAWLMFTQPPGTSFSLSDLKAQIQQAPVTQQATPVSHTSVLFKELELLVCLQLVHSGILHFSSTNANCNPADKTNFCMCVAAVKSINFFKTFLVATAR